MSDLVVSTLAGPIKEVAGAMNEGAGRYTEGSHIWFEPFVYSKGNRTVVTCLCKRKRNHDRSWDERPARSLQTWVVV